MINTKKEDKKPLLTELVDIPEHSPRIHDGHLQFNPPKMNIPPQRNDIKINIVGEKNETLIDLNVPSNDEKPKIVKRSDLPETSEELLQKSLDLLKKKILSEDRRNVIKDLCTTNSITCLQGKTLLDCFRISFEKKQILLDFIKVSDPENISVLLQTFDFIEDRNLMMENLTK